MRGKRTKEIGVAYPTTYLWLAMRAAGVTPRIVAGYMGVHTGTVVDWSAGRHRPSDVQLEHLAELLHINSRYALSLADKCDIAAMLTRHLQRVAATDDVENTFNEPQDDYPDDPNWSYE